MSYLNDHVLADYKNYVVGIMSLFGTNQIKELPLFEKSIECHAMISQGHIQANSQLFYGFEDACLIKDRQWFDHTVSLLFDQA